MHEMIYPVLQGYDSVMLQSDLTVVGRHLHQAHQFRTHSAGEGRECGEGVACGIPRRGGVRR